MSLQGKSTDLGINDFLTLVFTLNEEAPKAKKLTDEQILEIVFEEFDCYTHRTKDDPGFDKEAGHRCPQPISRMRSYFNGNREGLGDRSGKPKTSGRSRRYDAQGNVVKSAKKGSAPLNVDAAKKVAASNPALKGLLK